MSRFVALALVVALAACSGGGEVEFSARSVTGSAQAEADAAAADAPAEQGGLLPASAGDEQQSAPGAAPAAGATPQPGAGGTTTTTAPRSTEPIVLGTVLPLQGGERDFGEPILRTTQAFIDEVNARGGVNGRPLRLVAYHACLTCQGEALTAVRRLVEQDGVFAIVNPYPMVIAFQSVIPYLVDKGVPLIQGGAENQTSEALSPVNFTTAPSGLFYARFLPVLAARHMKVKSVGIVHLDVPSESTGIPILRREMAKEGVEVVAVESVAAAEEAVTNMDSVVTRMRAAGAEGIIALNPVVLIFGRLAARRQQWNAPWGGPAAWSRLVENGCGPTCDDVVFTDTAGLSYIDRDTPQMRQYVDTMARRFPGGELTGHTLAAWVGMQLTVEMLSRIGEPDRRAFIDALHRVRNLDLGTTSPLTFSPDEHMGGSSTVIIKLRDGRYYRASQPLDYGEAAR